MKSRTDASTAIGLGCGVGGLLIGFLLEHGNPLSLIGFSALLIIVTGTMGALIVSFSIFHVMRIPLLLKDSMVAANGPSEDIVTILSDFAERARRDGILSLEDEMGSVEEPFLGKGIRMVVDGVESEVIATTLENDIHLFELKKKEEIGLFEAAGGFSPTMGIVGTVMGLVLVLQSLGSDSAELGRSIATAFIATLYGIGLANLLWLPVANKLKLKLKLEKLRLELIMTGVLGIQQGEHPGLIRAKLNSYIGKDTYGEET